VRLNGWNTRCCTAAALAIAKLPIEAKPEASYIYSIHSQGLYGDVGGQLRTHADPTMVIPYCKILPIERSCYGGDGCIEGS